jgi:hypothetical protein
MKEATLLLRLQDLPSVLDQAVAYAQSHDVRLEVLLILGSHLYHYGHNDVVVPGKARAGFLTYVAEQVAEEGRRLGERVLSQAAERGVAATVKPIMEENCEASIHDALAGTSGPVLKAPNRRRLFPIFKSDPIGAALRKSDREVVMLS